jgi:hypothetical protein
MVNNSAALAELVNQHGAYHAGDRAEVTQRSTEFETQGVAGVRHRRGVAERRPVLDSGEHQRHHDVERGAHNERCDNGEGDCRAGGFALLRGRRDRVESDVGKKTIAPR